MGLGLRVGVRVGGRGRGRGRGRVSAVLGGLAQCVAREVEDDELGEALELLHLG